MAQPFPGKLEPIDHYLRLMAEVKRRHDVLLDFQTGQREARYQRTTVETAVLQLRLILECIAFASLVANKKHYAAQYKKFAEFRNARLLLRDLERVHPKFYPDPIVERPSTDPAYVMVWDAPAKGSFLSRDMFPSVYEKCSNLLHAPNPFGSQPDLAYYETNLPVWGRQVAALLDRHLVHLVGDYSVYLVQMNGNGYPTGQHFEAAGYHQGREPRGKPPK